MKVSLSFFIYESYVYVVLSPFLHQRSLDMIHGLRKG